jgi:hypothetical protein
MQMKRESIFSHGAVVVLCLCGLASAAFAEYYHWTPYLSPEGNSKEFNGSWDYDDGTNTNWTSDDPANADKYPAMPGDVAILTDGGTDEFFQIWLNQYVSPIANVAGLSVTISNEAYIGAGGTNGLVFNNPGGRSFIALTNQVPDHMFYINDNQIGFLFDSVIELSNALDISILSVPYESGGVIYEDAAGVAMDMETTWIGDYPINVYSRGGVLIIGDYYTTPPLTVIETTKPVTLNGTYLVLNESATIDPPVILRSVDDCRNEFQRSPFYGLGSTYNVDFILSNGYMNAIWETDWPVVTITKGFRPTGSVSVRDWGLIGPEKDDTTLIETTFNLDCDVSGDGEVWCGYSDADGGIVEFLGSISPGIGAGDRALLRIMALTNSTTVIIGSKTDAVTLNIDVDGMRNYFGRDQDTLAFDDIPTIPLGTVDLVIDNTGYSNPYRTNQIMFSSDSGFAGNFKSVTWVDTNRMGTVIIQPDNVWLTGIPAQDGFFDVTPDVLYFEQGETQQMMQAKSPFTVDVAAGADAPWVSIPSNIALNGSPFDFAVDIPADVGTTQGFGLAASTLTFVSQTDTNAQRTVNLYAFEPGYFELDTTLLTFFSGVDDTASIEAFAPFGQTISANVVEGDTWITLSDSIFTVTNDDFTVGVQITAQAPGATGRIRFQNTALTGVVHDVLVEVVSNGWFGVSPAELVYDPGVTVQTLTVSCPFRAEVGLSTSNADVRVTPDVSLNDSSVDVPVSVSEMMPEGTNYVYLVNKCFTNFAYTVPVIIVPEPGLLVTVLGLGAAAAFLRRARG